MTVVTLYFLGLVGFVLLAVVLLLKFMGWLSYGAAVLLFAVLIIGGWFVVEKVLRVGRRQRSQ